MNERETEDRVREHFKRDPLFGVVKLEEQKTTVPKARQCLSKASKHLTGKGGYPEFIMTFPALPDDIIVVECKANTQCHVSPNKDRPIHYAVDGVLHYARFLSSEYNVLAIAVSGMDQNKQKISSFYQKKGEGRAKPKDDALLDIYSYLSLIKGEAIAENIGSEEITKLAIELNNELNDYSIVEYERCTLVSAVLLALQDEAFRHCYHAQARTQKRKPRPNRLAQSIVDAIKRVLEENGMDDERVFTMISEYQTIQNKALAKALHIKKKRASAYEDNFFIRNMTQTLESKILPLMDRDRSGYDVLGHFYTEFIRYAGTDKKTGLVLTPRHITELFCDLVHLNKDDVVFDSCCGTGGFLVSAMKYMLALVGGDQIKRKHIKQNQLIGIEKRTDMFTFSCSNMMMSGDGKSHIYQGDCFEENIKHQVKALKPTVAFLNPPYDVGEDGQLEFIENTLSCLEKGGRLAAIVQMSCVTSAKSSAVQARERLIKKHTLNAVFSMPNELFHPVGVVTCVMLFEAYNPHPKTWKPYFGYYKNDGFIKRKNLGRIDSGQWSQIRQKWIDHYTNRENEAGFSVTHAVTAQDEWCTEAYIETNYQALTANSFQKTIKEIVSHYFSVGFLQEVKKRPWKQSDVHIHVPKWQWFYLGDLFVITGTKSYTQSQIAEYGRGQYPYVVTSSENNGVQGFYNHFTENGNVLTIDSATIGSCFYQKTPFTASDHVEKLVPQFDMNIFIALFIKTVINLEKFRYGYGRKFAQMRIKTTAIKLPFDKQGHPDWAWMEHYIKSLPYSSNLA